MSQESGKKRIAMDENPAVPRELKRSKLTVDEVISAVIPVKVIRIIMANDEPVKPMREHVSFVLLATNEYGVLHRTLIKPTSLSDSELVLFNFIRMYKHNAFSKKIQGLVFKALDAYCLGNDDEHRKQMIENVGQEVTGCFSSATKTQIPGTLPFTEEELRQYLYDIIIGGKDWFYTHDRHVTNDFMTKPGTLSMTISSGY